jgi:hypothetical protein
MIHLGAIRLCGAKTSIVTINLKKCQLLEGIAAALSTVSPVERKWHSLALASVGKIVRAIPMLIKTR